MLTLNTPDIPQILSKLHSPPKRLYVSNDSLGALIDTPRIGIVGSRKVSAYGRAVTIKLTSELAGKGVTVVSGLALGVDSIAHSASLQAGGSTIAVLPTGLDKIYPTSHAQLAKDIDSKGGLLLSEYPYNTEPMRQNFIARNRIIAGLSEGLLITEAAINSGSLHTAGFALEIGIPVFAVPGPITSPTSEGTNNLIKSGAIPVTCIEDIFEHMKWEIKQQKELPTAATEEERIILELISQRVNDGHELLERSELTAAKFNQALTMLELTGKIHPLGANHWDIS